MIKNIASIVLVIIWMLIIFLMSNSNGATSSSMSNDITEKIIETFTDIESETPKYETVSKKISFIVRKMAHFIEYFILGILLMNLMFVLDIKSWSLLLAIMTVVLYAMSDELHQVLVDGRDGNIRDVLLDSSAGIIAIYLYHYLIIKKVKYEENID